MIFDGGCNFCALWIRRWQHATGDSVDYLPFQDPRVAAQFPELPRGRCEAAVQLIEPEGDVYTGAEAVFRALAHRSQEHWLLDGYYYLPGFGRASEWGYRLVARHRSFFALLTRMGWGRHTGTPTHLLVRQVFLRLLGIIYLVAFLSLGTQITGLVGSDGIFPVRSTLAMFRLQMNSERVGLDRYHLLPTLCWFDASDRFLRFQCAAGTALALLVVAGLAPASCLFLLWIVYLSLCTVGRDFLGFPWDHLLLQTGFLAIFLAPLQLLPRSSRAGAPSRVALWLLRWLLFQVMFESACMKLVNGGPPWRQFAALTSSFETQPLPTWVAWHMLQLPAWAQKASASLLFGIELLVPFLIFAPRRPRQFACLALVCQQALIALTGNYGFLNFLTIALCLLLLDDDAIRALLPGQLRSLPALNARAPAPGPRRWPPQITRPLACICIAISVMHLGALSRIPIPWPKPIFSLYEWVSPLRTFNSYAWHPAMPPSRPEVVIEGSDDGVAWLEYVFKYKPGDVNRRPTFVAPLQPRLDWQMGLAGLVDYRRNPWIGNFCLRLMQGSPGVLALLERNPFPDAPPRYLRAVLYEYHFTDPGTRRKTGAWWRRERKGDYLPPTALHGGSTMVRPGL